MSQPKPGQALSGRSGIAVAALLAAMLLGAPAPGAAAGTRSVQLGVVQMQGTVREERIDTRVPLGLAAAAGREYRFDSPDVRIVPQETQTLGLSFTQQLARRLHLGIDLGYPPVVETDAHGRAGPPPPLGLLFPVDLDAPPIQPKVRQRVWSPVLSLQMRFRPGTRLQPYLAAGASYIWYTEEEVSDRFEAQLDREVGQALALAAGRPGHTRARIKTDPHWAPGLQAGLHWHWNEHWGLVAAASVLRTEGRSHFRLQAADGTLLSDSEVRVKAQLEAFALALSYRWP